MLKQFKLDLDGREFHFWGVLSFDDMQENSTFKFSHWLEANKELLVCLFSFCLQGIFKLFTDKV